MGGTGGNAYRYCAMWTMLSQLALNSAVTACFAMRRLSALCNCRRARGVVMSRPNNACGWTSRFRQSPRQSC
eukprot:7199694-Lingulodinium_polyedra.AAC.1